MHTVACKLQSLPYRNVRLEENVQTILDVVIAIRRLKNIFNVTAKHKPKGKLDLIENISSRIRIFFYCRLNIFFFAVCLVSESCLYKDFSETIEDLSSCDKVTFMNEIDTDLASKAILDTLGSNVKIYLFVPDEVRKSFESDVHILEKKRDKLMIELQKIEKIISADGYKIKASENTKQTNLKKVMNSN